MSSMTTISKIFTQHPVSFETVRDVLEKKFLVDVSGNALTDDHGEAFQTVIPGFDGKSFRLNLRPEGGTRCDYAVIYDIQREGDAISTVLTLNSSDIDTDDDYGHLISENLSDIFGGFAVTFGRYLASDDEEEKPSTLASFLGIPEADIKVREIDRVSNEIFNDLKLKMHETKLYVIDKSAPDAFVEAMQNGIGEAVCNSFRDTTYKKSITHSP